MEVFWIIAGAVVVLGAVLVLSIGGLICICQPNQVLIFSGPTRLVAGRRVGYRLIKGGAGLRRPFVERVDTLDLTNMIIELSAVGAYAKGGVPMNVQGVANVKIAGHEPVLNNAIERFLGKNRIEVMNIAKATLEGSLRGVLAKLTPEQINEDQNAFAEKLVDEVEQDMTSLGLVVDTLKIQSVTDDVNYMVSIGRIRNAEVRSGARVAEAIAKADAVVNAAQNQEREVETQIKAQISVAQADAQKRLTDALTRREAVVAEEQAAVAALFAQAVAEVQVQKARVDQVRSRLEADVIQPAKAECEALEQQAKAAVAPIIEEGKARADALMSLAESWQAAGVHAREIFVLQKLEPIIKQLTETIAETRIEKVTMIDSKAMGGGFSPAKLVGLTEQIKQLFGIDLTEKLTGLIDNATAKESASLPATVHVTEPVPVIAPVAVPETPAPQVNVSRRINPPKIVTPTFIPPKIDGK